MNGSGRTFTVQGLVTILALLASVVGGWTYITWSIDLRVQAAIRPVLSETCFLEALVAKQMERQQRELVQSRAACEIFRIAHQRQLLELEDGPFTLRPPPIEGALP
jgi:hypothetical protein